MDNIKVEFLNGEVSEYYHNITSFKNEVSSSLEIINGGFYFSSLLDRYFIRLLAGTLYISKSLKKIRAISDSEFNSDSIAFYQNFGFIYPPFTQYSDIFICCPFKVFSVVDNSLEYKSSHSIVDSNICPTKGRIEDKISDYLDFYLKDSKLKCQKAILLSGGIDSSVLLGLANSNYNLNKAYMCKMSSLTDEDVRARKQAEYLSLDFELLNMDRNLEKSAETFMAQTGEFISDPISLVFIELLKEIGGNEKHSYLIDGQGADSLFNGLPHDKLYDVWLKVRPFSFLFKIFYFIKIPSDKSSSFKRKIYRLAKVLKCFSKPTFQSALIASLSESGETPSGQVFEYFLKDIDHINSKLKNWHVALRYIFMFRILSAREMQKYLFCESNNISMLMPFLNEKIVKEYILESDGNNIVNGVYKYPMKRMVDKYWPGMFKNSATSPFQVNYSLSGGSIKDISRSYFNV